MIRKYFVVIMLLVSLIPLFLSSCGGGGAGGDKSPEVVVTTDTTDSSGDASSDADSGSSGSIELEDNAVTGDTVQYVVIIKTDSEGNLNINNETVSNEFYDLSAVSATDENGNSVTVSIDDNGDIQITPQDGSVQGTYTVTIDTGEREYLVIVEVDENNNPTVITAVSYPSGSSMVVDLDCGNLVSGNNNFATVSSGADGSYSVDSSVDSITVTDKNGNIVTVEIDPVTGDIITDSSAAGPYNVVIVMADGRVIIFQTDSTGSITGNVTESGRAVMLDLDSGSLVSGDLSLTLAEQGSDGWYIAGGVEILSAIAGDGTIQVSLENIRVNSSTGDIMITGGGTTTVPAGPYEVRISVDGREYVVKTDVSGMITDVVPGNTVFDLNNGYAVHSGNSIIKITVESDGVWSYSGQISSLTAKDSAGNEIGISIDNSTGDLVTAESASGEITATFLYTDTDGNVITYTFILINGNVISYIAEITDPGPDFDFSTVTNIRVSLKVADEKTGLPLGQASINLLKSDGTFNWQGFTNDSGISIFTATVDSANKTAKVIVARAGYVTLECNIEGIGKLIEFGKNIAMAPVEEAVVIDSDGDGVPDSDDEFPDDPSGAKLIEGLYTIAYEDLYPSKGDADFNDVVVRLTLEEKIDSQNRLSQIKITTKLLASGAGYHNSFGIDVNGQRVILIDDARVLLGSTYNSRSYESYVDVSEESYTMTFSSPVERSLVAPMPYDPFIICNSVEGREVHLPFVETSYTGKVLDSDGFTWALLVPEDWYWPYESESIMNAYPEFDDWYLSEGLNSSDWYLRPDIEYVFIKENH